MSRPLAEIEAESELLRRRSDTFNRITNGRLYGDTERLAREELHALDDELAALRAKQALPPPPPVLPDIANVSPAEAAERAAKIRTDPRYWDPSKANEKGERLSTEEHARLVREHQELLARAAEPSEGGPPNRGSPA